MADPEEYDAAIMEETRKIANHERMKQERDEDERKILTKRWPGLKSVIDAKARNVMVSVSGR